MNQKSRLAKVTSLALLVATLTIYTSNRSGAAANAAPTTAQDEASSSTDIDFGAIKLSRSQNALIIVVCAADPTGRDQRPVDVEFMFYDWDGNLLGSETKTILPGKASSFDISSAIRIPGRTSELIPSVKILADPSDSRAKRVTATLQLSDSESGKVQSLICRKAGGKPDEF
jgi:hypothetical protein